MEAWRAARVGLMAKVFFPAVNAGSVIKGARLTVKIVSVGPLAPQAEFIGEVMEEPTVEVGLKKGDRTNIGLFRIEEISS